MFESTLGLLCLWIDDSTKQGSLHPTSWDPGAPGSGPIGRRTAQLQRPGSREPAVKLLPSVESSGPPNLRAGFGWHLGHLNWQHSGLATSPLVIVSVSAISQFALLAQILGKSLFGCRWTALGPLNSTKLTVSHFYLSPTCCVSP